MNRTGKSSDHILVIRFSAMGDVAMSLFAIGALRRTYPDLRITIATKQRFVRFFKDIPDVEILALPPDGSFRSLFKLIREARRSGVNCVADIHNTIRGKIIRFCFRMHGADVAVFDKMRDARKALKNRKGRPAMPVRHNVLRFCDVFARLGYPVPAPELVHVTRPVPPAFGEKSGRWVGFAPFASKMMKIYPENLRRRLIGMMAAEFDRVFIFSGPGKEQDFASEMSSRYPNVTGVFGKTDIWGEMDLMSNLDAIVTMDSSAMHMASLVGAPLVTVWGATHPAAGFYAYGYDPDKSCVQLDMDCRPCSIYGEGDCARGDYACLSGIAPEMIMDKLRKAVGKK